MAEDNKTNDRGAAKEENEAIFSEDEALTRKEPLPPPQSFQESSPQKDDNELKSTERDRGKEEIFAESGIDSIDIEHQDKKKLMVLLLILAGLAVIGWGTYFAFGKIVKYLPALKDAEESFAPNQKNSGANPDKEAAQIEARLEEEAAGQAELEELEEEKKNKEEADSDNDGLLDVEEKELGTDPNNLDSDGDDLFDFEEIKFYKSDPLNPDSDGDGFLDGEEVKAGYNPIGEGSMGGVRAAE